MKKKLYYVVEKELQGCDSNDGIQETTGFKMITVYEIENNITSVLTTIDTEIKEDSQEMIQEYLDDNGMGDDEFEFIQL
jgi:hypothetical protein